MEDDDVERVSFASEIGVRDGEAYLDISTLSYKTGDTDGYYLPLEPVECFKMAKSLVFSGVRAGLCSVEDKVRERLRRK